MERLSLGVDKVWLELPPGEARSQVLLYNVSIRKVAVRSEYPSIELASTIELGLWIFASLMSCDCLLFCFAPLARSAGAVPKYNSSIHNVYQLKSTYYLKKLIVF